jgi:glyoxylase-like metal-dependent hydrolase (beta-lactamase superfamily II)
MRTITTLMLSLLLAFPLTAAGQDSKAALEKVSDALGAHLVTSLEYSGTGVVYAAGQSHTPGGAWPKFTMKSYTRTVNYATSALRDTIVRTQWEEPPRGGGFQPIHGERRDTMVVHGDHAFNMVGDDAVSAPSALGERQFGLWTTPHGIVKAALDGKGSMKGRTINVEIPNRFKASALVGDNGLIEKVSGVFPNPVLGDMPVEITYSDYKDFGGVKFPTRIRETAGGHPSLDLTVTDVTPNLVDGIALPASVRRNPTPGTRVTNEKIADGVWFIAGGSHNSVAIEMKDYVIVVEGPLTEQRAFAVINETRNLVPAKPIRYVVATHHHFDHSGGLRTFAAVNVTVVTHESARAFFEKALSTMATVAPDRLTRSGLTPSVQGVGRRQVLDDGTRRVEIHHIAGNGHAEDLLMVYLPKEKLLVQADVYTPLAPNVTPPTPPSPYTTAFADHLSKLGLAVDRIVPIHGRIVPVGELGKMIGR